MTYPLPTLAPTVSLTGISAPSYNDIYQSLVASFKLIYGSDIYIQPDSQDGQWLGVLAQAIYDCNQTAVAVFQAFSPTYAQGVGLSTLVKLIGIARNVATNSTAIGDVIGQEGAVITDGVVQDTAGNRWNLPASVTIPFGGLITVTVTAQEEGDLTANIGQINSIYNPQLGWQSFSNTANAIAGSPVESDAALRVRQIKSVAIPSLGIRESIYSNVSNLPGVTACTVHDNDTGSTDADGVPAHSIAVIVGGGDVQQIVDTIGQTKVPGGQTYGTTSGIYTDQFGLTTPINYFALDHVGIYYAVTVKALPGFDSIGTPIAIKQALADFSSGLDIGEDVYYSQAMAAASLLDTVGGTYYITSFFMGLAPTPVTTTNITIPFNGQAEGDPANTTVTVT